ncbi:MAG TPA: sugar phosphate nucleotidyltransferase [Acidimicrobiales bacterium]
MPAMMPQPPELGPAGLCAVVLAAGEGTRLRPLSRQRPKPLCPVGNVPLVDLAIERVRAATPDVAVNVHHDRDAIAAHLDGRVHLSVEEDEALGTAGALGHLRPWIDGRAVVVVNADTWCPGPLDGIAAGWDGERARLLLAGDRRLRPTSRIAAALLPWAHVAPLAPVPSGLYEVSWWRLAEEDRIDAVCWDGPCLDCGTPARYLHANLAASDGLPVVEPGAVVAPTAVVERSVLWAGAVVRPGEHLVDAVRTSTATVLVR